jgi:hypothetical protein
MKFSTSFTLFGISALALLAPNHSAFVSVELVNANSESSENIINNNVSGVSASPTGAPSDSVAPTGAPPDSDMSLPLIDPSGGHLSLLGIDLSEPLTKEEAAFLETTVREVFNKIHEEMDIDLVADSVTVGRDAVIVDNHNDDVVDANHKDAGSNLRGGSRKLERNIYGIPGPDIRPCTHHSGPLKGYGIEGCEWNIEIFLDCRCWMCLDDDFEIGVVAHRDWTPAPYYDFFRFLDDDDDYSERARATAKPTAKPTAAPSQAPSSSPTEDKEEIIGLEEERGPEEPPHFYRPPPSPSPFDQKLLKKLKKSRFPRFNNVKNARFHGWGN